MSSINLLPWREEKIFQKNNIFYVFCGITVIISFITVFVVNIYVKLLVTVQNNNNNYLDSQITFYQEKIKEINGLKEQKKMALSRLEVINSLQSKRSYVISILDSLARAVPDGIVLNQAELKDNQLVLDGQSDSNTRVSLFMRNLEEFKIFSSPKLQEIKVPQQNQTNEHGVSFIIEVQVTG